MTGMRNKKKMQIQVMGCHVHADTPGRLDQTSQIRPNKLSWMDQQ